MGSFLGWRGGALFRGVTTGDIMLLLDMGRWRGVWMMIMNFGKYGA